mmetsp:Transcript_16071/g.31063  ORF Transcript_16071/g.31063 Transcript_16071/m.31063 type:complete len:248 (+) Transcript_16071:1485-2228(+)
MSTVTSLVTRTGASHPVTLSSTSSPASFRLTSAPRLVASHTLRSGLTRRLSPVPSWRRRFTDLPTSRVSSRLPSQSTTSATLLTFSPTAWVSLPTSRRASSWTSLSPSVVVWVPLSARSPPTRVLPMFSVPCAPTRSSLSPKLSSRSSVTTVSVRTVRTPVLSTLSSAWDSRSSRPRLRRSVASRLARPAPSSLPATLTSTAGLKDTMACGTTLSLWRTEAFATTRTTSSVPACTRLPRPTLAERCL